MAQAALLALLPVVLSGAACAQDTLRGPAAYGDWHSDRPGVRRLIWPEDLPENGATASSSQSPRVVPRPSGASPAVPAGFTVQPWAVGLDTPRTLRTAPNGDVFLAESGAGRIRVWHPTPGTGQSGPAGVFASGLDQPFGIAFWPPSRPTHVYVAETNRIVRYAYDGGLRAAGPAEVVVPSLPDGGHWTRDLAVSPDGATLYVSVGSASNVATGMRGAPGGTTPAERGAGTGNEAGRAAVYAFAPAGGPLHLVASGIRNCVGLAVQPGTGALWCATNERDGMGDDLPPDYATRIAPGQFFGWPWYYIGGHEDPRHRGERPDLVGAVTVPDVLIQPHSAPLGITFTDGSAFGGGYAGDAFVTLHGSWNRARRTGYKVVRLPMRDGRPTGEYEDFLTGFVASADAVWGRPVGLTEMRDGSLLVSEDGNGSIWRVSR